jgi:heme-degrading monooxygenase HmoA
MKLTIPFMALAILALGPLTSANAQSSPPRHPPGASKSSTASAASKPSTSPAEGTSSNSFAGSPAPTASTTPSTRTEVYHVHFNKAALGKSTQLADNLKKLDPQDPMSGHTLILRHQEGDSWDYAVIQHLGPKATVDAVRPAPSPSARDLSDWHNDTFVNGPSWSEFTKAMGIDEAGDKTKTAGAVYVISVYRPAAGHRDQLERMLSERPGSGDTSAGNVLMQHLEGGPWTYLTIARYNSWQDFGTNESNSVAETAKGQGGWFQLREHTSFHTDTICDRIAP